MFRRAFLLIFIIISAIILSDISSAGIDPEYELNMSKGVSRLNSREYEDAIAIFKDILMKFPEDPDAMLMLGIAMNRKGMLTEAEEVLKKVADKQYDLPRTYYELGVIKYKKGDYAAAREYFNRSERISTDISLDSSIKAFVSDIERRQKKKRYNLKATLGLQYDSNVPLESTEKAVDRRQRADVRTVLFLKGDWMFVDSPVKAVAGYSLYQSLHHSLSDFNVSNHEFELKAAYSPVDNILLEAKYMFDYAYLGGEAYSRMHTITPSAKFTFVKNMPTRLVYEYSKRAFFDVDVADDNNNRSSDNNLFGIEQTVKATDNLLFRLAYYHDKNTARESEYSYNGNKYQVALYYAYQNKWALNAKAEYYDKNYSGDTEWAEWNDDWWWWQYFSKARHDITRTYAVSFIRPLSNCLSISLDQTFVINSSNIPFYKYERSLTGLFLTARF
ncbi:MAG: tetratricopeptide repeat protein [Nitrospirota bacterium]